LLIAVDSISFQLPTAQLPISGAVLLGLLVLGARRPLDRDLAALVLHALDGEQGLLGLLVRAEVDEGVLVPHDRALEHVAVAVEQLLHLLLVHVLGKVGHVEFGADGGRRVRLGLAALAARLVLVVPEGGVRSRAFFVRQFGVLASL
jgi:hypothetical protein